MADKTATRSTTDTTKWVLDNITPSTAAQTVVLGTANKYNDRDIQFTVNAMTNGTSAVGVDEIGGWSSNESTATSMVHTTDKPSSGNYYTLTAQDQTKSKISKGGYFATNTEIGDTATTYYVNKATTSSTAGTATASASTAVSSTIVSGTYSSATSKPSSGYYIEAKSSASSTASSASIGEGYNPSSVTVTGSAASPASKTAYTILTESTLKNGSTSISSGAQITPGSLQTITVGKGYYPSDRTITIKDTSTGTTATYSGGITTVSADNVATRGVYTNTAGYTAATTSSSPRLVAATFANTATSGTTYVDLSSTSDAPIISANGGFLYINEGYVDNLKISLAKLIPDSYTDSNGTTYNIIGDSASLRQNKSLFNENGDVVIGSMPDVNPVFTGGAVTVDEPVITPTAGSVTIEEDGTFFTSSSYGVTTTKPSGTDGTDYLTIDGKGTPTDGSVSVTATANRAAVNYYANYSGYLNVTTSSTVSAAPTTKASNSSTSDVEVDINDQFEPYYIPVISSLSQSFAAISSSNVTLSDTSNGISVTGTGAVKATSAGVIAKDTSGSISTTSYITGITVPNTTGFNLKTVAATNSSTSSNTINITNGGSRVINYSGGDDSRFNAEQTYGVYTISAHGNDSDDKPDGTVYIDCDDGGMDLAVAAKSDSDSYTILSDGRWVQYTVSKADTYYYGKVKANAGSITASDGLTYTNNTPQVGSYTAKTDSTAAYIPVTLNVNVKGSQGFYTATDGVIGSTTSVINFTAWDGSYTIS